MFSKEWIQTARERSITEIALLLGLGIRHNRLGPCPSCGVEQERGNRRGIVGIFRNRTRWKCNGCGASGDSLELVALAKLGKPTSALNRDGWKELHLWFEGTPLPSAPSFVLPPPPDYPPLEKVTALWQNCGALPGSLHHTIALPGLSGRVCTWLKEERGLGTELVGALDLLRVAPTRKTTDLLPGWPWIAVLPLVEATGTIRSFRFRSVESQKTGPKSRTPTGYAAAGLVLACPMGRALLAGRTDVDGIHWNGRVELVEGEPDYLTLAAHPRRITQGQTFAVLGWMGSDGLPAEVARRLTAKTKIRIFPHQDTNGAGEHAAARTAERLAHVIDVRKAVL